MDDVETTPICPECGGEGITYVCRMVQYGQVLGIAPGNDEHTGMVCWSTQSLENLDAPILRCDTCWHEWWPQDGDGDNYDDMEM